MTHFSATENTALATAVQLTAAEHLGRATKGELIRWAHRYWPAGLNNKELLECLRLENNGCSPAAAED